MPLKLGFTCEQCGLLGSTELGMREAAFSAMKGKVHLAIPDDLKAMKGLMEKRKIGYNNYAATLCREVYECGWTARCKADCNGVLAVNLESLSIWASPPKDTESFEDLIKPRNNVLSSASSSCTQQKLLDFDTEATSSLDFYSSGESNTDPASPK